MKPICILKTGTPPEHVKNEHGDFDRFFINNMSVPSSQTVVVDVCSEFTLSVSDYSGVIITGSPSNVTTWEPWMERLSQWLHKFIENETPILGVCFGHQFLAHILGGTVDFHPKGMEIGTVPVQLTNEGTKDPLLGKMPREFSAHVIHSQTVLNLPPGAKVLAENNFEPHHAIAFIENQVWGVQFHPEFNKDIIRTYLQVKWDELLEKGMDPHAILEKTTEHSYGKLLLRQFIKLCLEKIKVNPI